MAMACNSLLKVTISQTAQALRVT